MICHHRTVAVFLLAVLCACSKPPAQISQDIAIPNSDANAERHAQDATAADYPRAMISTDAGAIVIELYDDKAPLAVQNFIRYAEARHYDNTTFHRVIDNLLIQGGAYTPDYRLKPDSTFIRSEANNGLRNLRGTLAAARRANDPNSIGAQFFINLVDNPQFDYVSDHDAGAAGYTVFGRVVDGMTVVDGMRDVKVAPRAGIGDAVPVKPRLIHQIRIVQAP